MPATQAGRARAAVERSARAAVVGWPVRRVRVALERRASQLAGQHPELTAVAIGTGTT